jgi:acetyl esterase/lipase
MQKYTPDGVAKLADQSYRASDSDAKLDVYYPNRQTFVAEHLPVVIWTHGGAWISGDKSDAEPYYRLLASKGYVVVAVNYTLAPAKSYPTQINQLNEAHKYIVENATRFHIDANDVFLAGDSAGSQLSAEMAALVTNPQYAREVGVAPALKPSQLQGVILNCGIYKMEGLTQPDPTLPKIVGWGNDVAVWSYAGTRDFSSPVIRQMSPYYHVTKTFPATYITGGNGDPLTDAQSKPFADELQGLGVKVTSLFYDASTTPRLPHEYQFHLDTVAGQKAYSATAAFIEAHVKHEK